MCDIINYTCLQSQKNPSCIELFHKVFVAAQKASLSPLFEQFVGKQHKTNNGTYTTRNCHVFTYLYCESCKVKVVKWKL